ncbi:MAG: ComEA family DNA-binding protein [Acinetobacter sp.]
MLSCFAMNVYATNDAKQFDQQYAQWKNKQAGAISSSNTNTEKLSLNSATQTELQQKLFGVGEKKAQAIIQYRQKNGKFNSIDELKNVKGIGDKLFQKNRERLRL